MFKQVVKTNTVKYEQRICRNLAPVDTGNMKRSITNGVDRRWTYSGQAGPHTDYAGYVEYGTRFQAAQPFVKPAYDVQKRRIHQMI